MILETIRMVADALKHQTYGVNVKLAALPLDDSDLRPEPVAVIVDETRNGDVAHNRLPPQFPSLSVLLNSSVNLDGEVMTTYREAEVPVLIRVGLSDVSSDIGNSDALYILRAVEQTIRDLNRNSNAADATRNGVQLIECKSIQHVNMYNPVEDKVITSGLVVTYRVRDTNA